MRVLLDTCVISELQHPQGNLRVIAHVDAMRTEDLFVSVITFGELTKGVALLAQGARRRQLALGLLEMEQRFTDRILPIDVEVARIWAELTAPAQLQGTPIPIADGLIAATALRHGLHVMTRNARHFADSGAPIIDPWED